MPLEHVQIIFFSIVVASNTGNTHIRNAGVGDRYDLKKGFCCNNRNNCIPRYPAPIKAVLIFSIFLLLYFNNFTVHIYVIRQLRCDAVQGGKKFIQTLVTQRSFVAHLPEFRSNIKYISEVP